MLEAFQDSFKQIGLVGSELLDWAVGLLDVAVWPFSPAAATPGRHLATGVATAHCPQPHLFESGQARSPSPTHHPSFQRRNRIPSVDSGLVGMGSSIGTRVGAARDPAWLGLAGCLLTGG